MDKEDIKNKIDLNNIQELITKTGNVVDYLVDSEGHFIIPISPLIFKLIEKIKELEARIIILEKI